MLLFYYVHAFSYDFIFGYAIFPAYFQLKGTSPEIIGALLAFWAACIVLFEVPTGLLADSVNRRTLLVLSPLVKAACFLIWIFADGQVYLYFVGMAFWSLASALRSGTKEAWLYEHVAASTEAHRYTAILGRERALQETATLTGAALGGLIASQSLELAFWTSLAPLTVCALAACFLTDMRQDRAATTRLSIGLAPGLLALTLREFLSKPDVRHVTLYVVLCVTFLGTLEDFNQLFLLAIKVPVWSIGVIVAAIGLARVVLAYHANWFDRIPGVGWLAPMASGASLIASGFLPPLFALLAMASAFILLAPLLVVTMSRFQKALDSASRATTTSIMSACTEAFSVLFNVAIAILFSQLSVISTYQVCGAYLVLFSLWELLQTASKLPLVRTAAQQKIHIIDVERNDSVS